MKPSRGGASGGRRAVDKSVIVVNPSKRNRFVNESAKVEFRFALTKYSSGMVVEQSEDGVVGMKPSDYFAVKSTSSGGQRERATERVRDAHIVATKSKRLRKSRGIFDEAGRRADAEVSKISEISEAVSKYVNTFLEFGGVNVIPGSELAEEDWGLRYASDIYNFGMSPIITSLSIAWFIVFGEEGVRKPESAVYASKETVKRFMLQNPKQKTFIDGVLGSKEFGNIRDPEKRLRIYVALTVHANWLVLSETGE